MSVIAKFATSLDAVAAFGAIIFASASAGSMKPAQSATVVAATDASKSRAGPSPASGPLNSKEASQEQLKDLQC